MILDIEGWNTSPRGAGFIFGKDVVTEFNRRNNIELICRAHQLVMEGYKPMFNDQLVTVWSAPNYCYRCGNVASILELDENLNKYYKIFEAAPNVRIKKFLFNFLFNFRKIGNQYKRKLQPIIFYEKKNNKSLKKIKQCFKTHMNKFLFFIPNIRL